MGELGGADSRVGPVRKRARLLGGGSVTRFEMLIGTKEHELQHRAQLTVLGRMLGIVPRFTGLA